MCRSSSRLGGPASWTGSKRRWTGRTGKAVRQDRQALTPAAEGLRDAVAAALVLGSFGRGGGMAVSGSAAITQVAGEGQPVQGDSWRYYVGAVPKPAAAGRDNSGSFQRGDATGASRRATAQAPGVLVDATIIESARTPLPIGLKRSPSTKVAPTAYTAAIESYNAKL